ncbi:MAG: glycoside hydrolase family 127 protein [Clostridia bacterium]|nr:glycoside hydrolase family 127 protein [Clostridia bacterium]
MKNYGFESVNLTKGYFFDKYELNRKITIDAVYDRFAESGRIEAFKFNWTPDREDLKKPHFFWDSDVAKWMEGAAYLLKKAPNPELEKKIDDIVAEIKKNQCEDGYFNIYFTVVEPENRWKNRDWHELYCAGHLFEAAVALKEIGKPELLECMDKYVGHIHKVFVEEKSATFNSPGHEEIEIALVRLYTATGNKKYLDLAAFFINTRGTEEDAERSSYNQSHLPVREQDTALGHSVRAMYLYTSMAMLAKETNDEALFTACKNLWKDVTERKMYVTGGIGSEAIGECFTVPFDLSNDRAYTETCAGIGLMFFARAMSELDNDAKYADIIERVFYNGVMSGLSLDGEKFFYENPLEINLFERFENRYGKRRLPITQRPKIFSCSCCPPNINRLLASIGNYVFAKGDDVLYINQYTGATLSENGVECEVVTEYPNDGSVKITARGIGRVAVRIPFWCDSFKINKAYTLDKGYAYIQNDESPIEIDFDMPVVPVFSDARIIHSVGKLCVMRGPVVYCAEAIDNGENLHALLVPEEFSGVKTEKCEKCGLMKIQMDAYRTVSERGIYSRKAPTYERTALKLIPYSIFANRGESDMCVWFRRIYSLCK